MAYRKYSGTHGYGAYTAEDADLADQEFNDERLQKAIQYLKTEGSGDAIDLYLTRVQTIDEHILRQFPAQGRSFDHRLYQHLRDLVREVQDDVQAVDDEESLLDYNSESSVEALFKDAEDDSDIEIISEVPAVARSSTPRSIIKTKKTLDSGAPTRNKEQIRLASTSCDDDVREKRFLYGGPNNDPEVWHKKSAPLLHIGESPYMERWESIKINRDLAKARGKSPDKLKSPQLFNRVDMYDSGSQYKLPTGGLNNWSQSEDQYAKIQRMWFAANGWFNTGRGLGPPKAPREGQDYAPRMILPLVGDIDVKPFVKSTPRISEGQEDSDVPADEISDERVLTPSQRSPLKSGKFTRLPETNLKKFNSTREAATRRDKSSPLSPRERQILETRTALATTPTPQTRLAPGPSNGLKSDKRKPGRPAKKPQEPSYHPIDSNTSASDEDLNELFGIESAERKRARPANKPKDPSYRPPRRVSQDEDSPITPGHATTIGEELHELLGTESTKRKRARPASKPKDPSYRLPRRVSQDADSPITPDRPALEAELNELTGSGPAKTKRVRPHKDLNDPDWTPDQSPITPTKRKRDETLYPTPSSKRTKVARKMQTPSSLSSSMHVEFAGETPTPARKAVPSRKATPTKSAIKKSKRVSAEDRELANTETLERRGKTMSKREFKPERLRSRDKTKG
ncbi:hypothetical protein P171DRAFT_103822 [Karstenula rhodostoma CBS 690.94]|uniref:Uncharacterized protein n=1 Tax=Karstenula rhodostoma CBS 690.94 TaxID=1392251 RepID=A0A9P4PAR1_9PLEO|nr:hypothetical protein P171DRAFT_103822 [Karstenula rhodostoma CBS 690.94]